MRKIIRAIFVISALVALVLCSACVLPSFGEQKKQEGGLTQVTVVVESSRISFEDAYQNLIDYRTITAKNSPENNKIYYILAKDVDDSGKAISWVFGVKNATNTLLYIYDGKSWTVIPWIITTLPDEITINQMVSPGNLLTQNKEVILSTISSTTPDRRDLELQQDIYKFNIYSGNAGKILTFNATTGALITIS